MCGETVLTIDGKRKPFAGFVSIDKVKFENSILITDIDAFTNGDEILDAWIDLNRRDWLLAIEEGVGISLVVKDGMPVIVCKGNTVEPEIKKHVSNVRSINSAGMKG
jgi:hypothetical protein